MRRRSFVPVFLSAALALVAVPAVALTIIDTGQYANVKLTVLSMDPFNNTTSFHDTEVEPDSFSYGTTMVSVFQQGRFSDGGASDIGWATTTDGGKTWKNGSLKGITKVQSPKNPYDRASDPSIAYDAKHGVWLAETLPLISTTGQQPVVSLSPDGLKWSAKPVKVAPDNGDFIDKPWIVCDNWSKSKYFGNCYIEEDDATQGDQEYMLTSSDGGKHWSTPYAVPGLAGIGGQPVVQPSGTVIVPDYNIVSLNISAFSSKDGGKTWGNVVTVAPVNFHSQAAQNFRDSEPLPSAEIDGAGTVYVAWADCSFRKSCASDDIVYSTSTNGTKWSAVQRVPIDKVTSTADHFLPGIAVDPSTKGASAHVAVTYYYFPTTSCGSTTCKLYAGYTASTDAGKTWSKPLTLAGPINLTWLVLTNQGYMIGDYISTSFLGGLGQPAIVDATKPTGTDLNEFIATSAMGLPAISGFYRNSSAGERPWPGAHSNYRPPLVAPI